MASQGQQEPVMEDVLASIKKILSFLVTQQIKTF